MSFFPEMKLLSKSFLALLVCVQAAFVFPASAGENILRPDGVNPDAGWALNRVGEMFSPGGTYCYPDTTVPVRLYLIDTGVANPASFVAANPKLTFEGPIPVNGAVSVPRAHGTQMLSLIAGKDTGVASGTPIHVVNYDIYTSEDAVTSTTITNLATAISKAVRHYRQNTPKIPAAICIATSSQVITNNYVVEDLINQALAAGIPVIVSAGNLGQEVPVLNYTATNPSTNSSYLPSAYGTKDGVICVGSSDDNDVLLSTPKSLPGYHSNFGAPVDILAPGLNVRTRSESATSAFVPMTGTSPAAALVTGAVLAKLSASPTHTPAGIESALKTAAESAASGPRILRSIVAPTSNCVPPDVAPDGPITDPSTPTPLTWDQATAAAAPPTPAPPTNPSAEVAPPPAPDTDADGVPDIIETFHGASQGVPQGPAIMLSAGQMQFKFPIDGDLFDGNKPFNLRNGHSWRVRCSPGLSGWTVPSGKLEKMTDEQGRAWLIATFPATQPACFARIEVFAP